MADRLHIESATAKDHNSSGFTVILVHGGASSHRMYAAVTPLLIEQGYNVLAPDLPGHGSNRSTAPEQYRIFSYPSAVTWLKEVIEECKSKEPSTRIALVGISLGGQAVLHFLSKFPQMIDAAIVSGASIHPPDDRACWVMPHLPLEDAEMMDMITKDVAFVGQENLQGLQNTSLGFTFDVEPGTEGFPPTLIMMGEHDTAMSKRDFDELTEKVRKENAKSKGMILEDAWHNHPIDVPEPFADAVDEWLKTLL